MRAVIQRVASASVTTIHQGEPREVGGIGGGFLILLGVRTDDTEADAAWLAGKVAGLRVFEDDAGRLNLGLGDVGGSVLLISNFTLYGDCRKGRRPSFAEAAPAAEARALYESVGQRLAALDIPVRYGEFGAEMRISLVNDGPVTLVIDTPGRASKPGAA
jgi:D-tyrosyl-tRNA(Tyr) deacylase